MSAVSNTEVFQLLLDRMRGQCDIISLLSQRDINGWSCLRHACAADNIEVVRILVEKYSYNWVEDHDNRQIALMDFVTRNGRNHHIKKFLLGT